LFDGNERTTPYFHDTDLLSGDKVVEFRAADAEDETALLDGRQTLLKTRRKIYSRSRLRSDGQVVVVAGGCEAVTALVWGEAAEGPPDGVPKVGHGAGGCGPQQPVACLLKSGPP